MIDELQQRFRDHFGATPAVVARAPGRVNWIGEHTDYNQGLVLPCAIDRATGVALAPRDDGRFRIVSRELAGEHVFPSAGLEARGNWADYARGAVHALAAAGAKLPGADLAVASDVPPGSGLSSSAALLVALVTAFDAAFALGMTPWERVRCAWRAEHDFVGVPCGIMDPAASALAKEGQLLRLDCRTLASEPVPLPVELRLLIVDSGVTRRLTAGDYGDRRAECEQAFAAAREAGIVPPEATSLRDLGAHDLPALERALPEAAFRRVRHVITENARVLASCDALRAGDLEAAGMLLREGQRSLRDDFAVSVPELDALCELGDATPGIFGSRLTGAGFGGCTLHAVQAAAAEGAMDAIAAGFEARFGRRPESWLVEASQGAAIVGTRVVGTRVAGTRREGG